MYGVLREGELEHKEPYSCRLESSLLGSYYSFAN